MDSGSGWDASYIKSGREYESVNRRTGETERRSIDYFLPEISPPGCKPYGLEAKGEDCLSFSPACR